MENIYVSTSVHAYTSGRDVYYVIRLYDVVLVENNRAGVAYKIVNDPSNLLLIMPKDDFETKFTPHEPPKKLTDRQYAVILGISNGKTEDDIAEDLNVSRNLVAKILGELYAKHRVRSRGQLIYKFATGVIY